MKTRLDSDWTDYVLSHLTNDEKVKEGDNDFPKIAGLRRVVPVLLGNIKESTSGNPVPIQGGVSITHTISCCLKEEIIQAEGLNHFVESYSGSADCTETNGGFTKDYATAFADTRAEARSLVRLLRLNRCSADELGPRNKKFNDAPSADKADMHVIDILTKRLSINKDKYFKEYGTTIGGKGFSVDNINRDQAKLFAEHLNEFQQNPQDVPKKIRN